MSYAQISAALSPAIGSKLAEHLIGELLKMRADVATQTYERSSPGKFVESVVQALQQIATGQHDDAPDVERFLTKTLENQLLPDGLRIVVGRVARSIYAVRNKRNIAHKGEVDPNSIDLAYAHHAAAWIMAEFVRSTSGLSMEEAGGLIALLQAPVGSLIEEIDGVRLVHADVAVGSEILLLLHSHYPEAVAASDIKLSLGRRNPKTVTNNLGNLERRKLLQRVSQDRYRLTQPGYASAVAIIAPLLS